MPKKTQRSPLKKKIYILIIFFTYTNITLNFKICSLEIGNIQSKFVNLLGQCLLYSTNFY